MDAGKELRQLEGIQVRSANPPEEAQPEHRAEIGCTLICQGHHQPAIPVGDGAGLDRGIRARRGVKDVAVIRLAEFSFEERLRRIQEVLPNHLGSDEWSCWTVDTYDNRGYYRRRSTLDEISYATSDDGIVTFEPSPKEAVANYSTLRARADPMKTIRLKDPQSREVQVDVAMAGRWCDGQR